jgi:hypothetical protein
MPGLTPGDLQFADRLVSAGYRVYAPLIFGVVGQHANDCRLQRVLWLRGILVLEPRNEPSRDDVAAGDVQRSARFDVRLEPQRRSQSAGERRLALALAFLLRPALLLGRRDLAAASPTFGTRRLGPQSCDASCHVLRWHSALRLLCLLLCPPSLLRGRNLGTGFRRHATPAALTA